MSKKTSWKTTYAEVLERAEEVLERGLTVKDLSGNKGKLVQIDREDKIYTFLIRYGRHHLAWIGVGDLFIPNENGGTEP